MPQIVDVPEAHLESMNTADFHTPTTNTNPCASKILECKQVNQIYIN